LNFALPRPASALLTTAFVLSTGQAQSPPAHVHGMNMDSSGAVMNENTDVLPRDCASITGDQSLTVYAGREFAADYPGMVFGLSEHEYTAEPCSRITVTFINKDEIRHQWMIHGLPKYLYPAGMFHIEAEGGQSRTGTFIVPSDNRTYLIHCDMSQHMEKGMKAQLKVGRGSGDLWSIPGISGNLEQDSYVSEQAGSRFFLAFALGLLVTLGVSLRWP